MADYKVITTNSQDDLETKVKQYLNAGWSLAGGIAYVVKDNIVYFGQALKK